MDFDEVAEAQGWDTLTMLCIAREYISLTDGSGEGLAEHARHVAEQENAG